MSGVMGGATGHTHTNRGLWKSMCIRVRQNAAEANSDVFCVPSHCMPVGGVDDECPLRNTHTHTHRGSHAHVRMVHSPKHGMLSVQNGVGLDAVRDDGGAAAAPAKVAVVG